MRIMRVSKPFTVTLVRDGIGYEVVTSIDSIRFGSGESSKSVSVTAYCYKREGNNARQAYQCYFSVFKRTGTTYTYLTRYSSKVASRTFSSMSVPSTVDALVVFATDTVVAANASAPASYVAKTEIAVSKDGANGADGIDGADGRNGADGAEGRGISSIVKTYARSADYTTADDSTPPTLPSGEGWTSYMPALNSVYQYLWCREVTTFTKGSPATVTKYYMIGTKGQTGGTGKQCYSAGDYKDTIEYTSNEYQTVSVEVPINGSTEAETWVLEAATNVVNGVHIHPHDNGQAVWRQGVNTNLTKTKYLFADFGHLGSFVIVGDWLLSAKGKVSLGARTVGLSTSYYIISVFTAKSNGNHRICFDLSISGSATVNVALSSSRNYSTSTRIGSLYSLTASGSYSMIRNLNANTMYYLLAKISTISGGVSGSISMPTMEAPVQNLFFDPARPFEDEYGISITNDRASTTLTRNTGLISLTGGITYMLTFTVEDWSGYGNSMDFYLLSSGMEVIEPYTVGANGTYRMVVCVPASGDFYFGCIMTSGSATLASLSVTAMFFPAFAVDGLTGESYHGKTHVKGEVYAENGEFTGMVRARKYYTARQTVSIMNTGTPVTADVKDGLQIVDVQSQSLDGMTANKLRVPSADENEGMTLDIYVVLGIQTLGYKPTPLTIISKSGPIYNGRTWISQEGYPTLRIGEKIRIYSNGSSWVVLEDYNLYTETVRSEDVTATNVHTQCLDSGGATDGSAPVALPSNINANDTVDLPVSPKKGMVVFCLKCTTMRTGGASIKDSSGNDRGSTWNSGNSKPRIMVYDGTYWREFYCGG